ncbi:unnamed protein product, partial [Phaeothamnion confervicola]
TQVRLEAPAVVHAGKDFAITVVLPPFLGGKPLPATIACKVWEEFSGESPDRHLMTTEIVVNGKLAHDFEIPPLQTTLGAVFLRIDLGDKGKLGGIAHARVSCMPGWASLFPPLVTLVLSVLLRQVIVALLVGVWAGATIICAGAPLTGFARTFDTYFVNSFASEGHVKVLLFTFLLGGTIGLVQRSGGALGMAQGLKRFMRGRRNAMVCCLLLSAMVFFDDYSSILIVGSSLRAVLPAVQV